MSKVHISQLKDPPRAKAGKNVSNKINKVVLSYNPEGKIKYSWESTLL